jgi:hypothetical protein
MASMEAVLDEGTQPDALGDRRRTRLHISVQWPRPLMELGSATHESGATEETVGLTGSGLDTGIR